MGYNIEESLPLLILHSKWLGDEEKLSFYADRAADHLEFLLPDGGIDNSFGTRQNKWTYWGSRTSDGMQEGFVYIMNRDPVFAKAALRSFRMLQKCTHGGYLYGGPMAKSAGEPACLHHAFTHAKALTAFRLEMDESALEGCEDALLPREIPKLKSFQNGNLYTVTRGKWTATVNACDLICYPNTESTGGAITLLWNADYGAILASTNHKFNPTEPANMQYQRNADEVVCNTPRVICGEYTSDNDLTVRISADGSSLVCKSEKFPLTLRYSFDEGGVDISVLCERDGVYRLPVISDGGDGIAFNNNCVCFRDTVKVCSDTVPTPELPSDKRLYNQVGGFRYFPLVYKLEAGKPLNIRITRA